MTEKTEDREGDSFGLVAFGTSGPWEFAVDESVSGAHQWSAQIDGPSWYLHFRIENLLIIQKMSQFLQSHLRLPGALPHSPDSHGNVHELPIDRDKSHAITLLWDNEEATGRCFVLINNESGFCIRLSIAQSDLLHWSTALQQVQEDLCEEGLCSRVS